MEEIKFHQLDVYPIVQHYMQSLGFHELFAEHLPLVGGQTSHANCLCVLISNIIIGIRPLYKISEWLGEYVDGKGVYGYQSNEYTDDRLGNALDALYAADRHTLMTKASSNAIRVHALSTDVVHNDSTTISFSGAYESVGDEQSIVPKRGHNKDGRPDAKQLIFNLNMLGDGHVPIHANFHDGNTSDSQTHIPNWEVLKAELKRTDFLYISDSKGASKEIMSHISGQKGRFISMLPATRKEVRDFLADVGSEQIKPEWQAIMSKMHSRKKDQVIEYKANSEQKTEEGYTIHWIHSSAKAQKDKNTREQHLDKAHSALEELSAKLNTYHLKEEAKIRTAIDKILAPVDGLIIVELIEHQQIKRTKIGRGRIGPNSTFKEEKIISYSIEWSKNTPLIEQQQRTDGLFPLVSNTDLSAKQVLENYKNQPYLEKKFSTLKSVVQAVPVFLKLPHRIEAMLFLYFLALMIIALIERQIHQSMQQEQMEALPILPQKMKTPKPTWNNIRYFFRSVFFFAQDNNDQAVATLTKGLTKLHKTILRLLKVPLNLYQINHSNWWKFSST